MEINIQKIVKQNIFIDKYNFASFASYDTKGKEMLDEGLITQEDYEKKKKAILDQI